MKNTINLFLLTSIVFSLLFLVLSYQKKILSFYADSTDFLAATFFVPSITSTDLRNSYEGNSNNKKLKIIIVPGHEPKSGGTEYKGLAERDMAVLVAESLAQYLSNNSHFDVFVARNNQKWKEPLATYFKEHRESILLWRKEHKDKMEALISAGKILESLELAHGIALDEDALHLYGVQKWANETGVDIIIHLHFNDYPRSKSVAGIYSGFAIYVPEDQYSNAQASYEVAQSIFNRFFKIIPVSNLKQERDGIVKDQELIAIGRFNTADTANILIEYGYIYEPQYRDGDTRKLVLDEYAYQTFLGIEDFFGSQNLINNKEFQTLPYAFSVAKKSTELVSGDTFALQLSLLAEGFYPPAGKSLSDCPLSGYLGPCTKSAISAFKKEKSINERDFWGSESITKLKEAKSVQVDRSF